VHIVTLQPTTIGGNAWTGREDAVIGSVTGRTGDSFGAAVEYLGSIRSGEQSMDWAVLQARSEVSMLVGAPDWTDGETGGNRFGAMVLLHLAVIEGAAASLSVSV